MKLQALVFFLMVIAASPTAAQHADGKVNSLEDGSLVAWDADSDQWLTLEEFWLAYASRRGGLTWGRGPDYPPYSQVSELDTFLVETGNGPCLMEFFHTRWRRANDVRRWDPAFNSYGGCPTVFD